MRSIRFPLPSAPTTPRRMADAVLNVDSLLVYGVARLGAHAVARTTIGARVCRAIAQRIPSWMQWLPGARVLESRPLAPRAMRWLRTSVNVACEILKCSFLTLTGAGLGGDEGAALGAQVYLGMAGVAHGARAGVAEHDRRAVQDGTAEELIRTRRADGQTEADIEAWISEVDATPTRGTFGIPRRAPSRKLARTLADALRRVLEEERAMERAAEKQRRARAALDRRVEALAPRIAPHPALQSRLEQVRHLVATGSFEAAERQLTALSRDVAQQLARPARRKSPTQPDPAPTASTGSRRTPPPTSIRLRQLIKTPPAALRAEDLLGAHFTVIYRMTEEVFTALAADYAANSSHRAHFWRALGQDPADSDLWTRVPDPDDASIGSATYAHRIGRAQLLVRTTDDQHFDILGLRTVSE